jgi:formate hydrogenlyase subunit 3/multisubunit Na+/H+ antiporter MnhD subunit
MLTTIIIIISLFLISWMWTASTIKGCIETWEKALETKDEKQAAIIMASYSLANALLITICIAVIVILLAL